MSYMGDGIEPVDITPEISLTPDQTDTGWDAGDWGSLLNSGAQAFSTAFNAVNHPSGSTIMSSPAPYSGGGVPATTSSSSPTAATSTSDWMAKLTDFSTAYPYLAIGGTVFLGVILVRAMGKR